MFQINKQLQGEKSESISIENQLEIFVVGKRSNNYRANYIISAVDPGQVIDVERDLMEREITIDMSHYMYD